MKAAPVTPFVNKVDQLAGMFRRAVLIMVGLFMCYGISAAQAREQEYASIYRPGGSLGQTTSLTVSTTQETEEAPLPVNLRSEIGHFFDEPNEGVLKLPFNLSGKSDVTVTITTATGATAYHLEREDVAPGQLELIIDMRAAGLTDGEYMVQIGLSRSQASAHYAQSIALR